MENSEQAFCPTQYFHLILPLYFLKQTRKVQLFIEKIDNIMQSDSLEIFDKFLFLWIRLLAPFNIAWYQQSRQFLGNIVQWFLSRSISESEK